MSKRKAKIIQLRVVIRDAKGNRLTKLIDEKRLNEIQAQFVENGGDLFNLLISESYESKIYEN
jgi:hypothetical protein